MSQNISKYVQINDFVLLEYEFNRDEAVIDISNTGVGAAIATTKLGTKQYFNNYKDHALGVTNNILELNSTPEDALRSAWVNNYEDINEFNNFFESVDSSLNTNAYRHDSVKLHIISGYNFDDIAGFLLQIRAEDSSSNYVDLTNFTYIKQPEILGGSDVLNFSSNTLYLGNRFYDKYVELKIPSVQALGEDTAGGFDTSLGQSLNIKPLSDVFLTYSTVPEYTTDNGISDNNRYKLEEELNVQLPVVSNADNFNAFIAESNTGDFIEFYGTWNDTIIGQYIGDIESGRIPLYTSNNPNDNYEEFSDTYGSDTKKWVIIHEISVYEQLPSTLGGSNLESQKYVFTQEDNFNLPNYFRPVLKNADIAATYTIDYICRLSNRMDGSQIIRRASFASTNPKKYGLELTKLNIENIIPYKVFNKIQEDQNRVASTGADNKPITKYIKIFYDTTKVMINEQNEAIPQGTGPLFLKTGGGIHKMKFEKLNTINGQREKVDLSGAYDYALMFILDDKTKIEAPVFYSPNMNSTIGDIDFRISSDNVETLLEQTNNKFSLIIKNPDKSNYTFYEGFYYPYSNTDIVMANFKAASPISKLQNDLSTLRSEYDQLKIENTTLRTQNNN